MYLFWEPPHSLIQPRYDQVLTGVLPHRAISGSNKQDMAVRVRGGRRPSRPRNPSQRQWLPDHVWDVIRIGWGYKPEMRCDLFVMEAVFWKSCRKGEEVPNTKTGQRQFGKVLPQIASFFRFLRDSEPEVQRHVDELDEVSFHLPTSSKANTNRSV